MQVRYRVFRAFFSWERPFQEAAAFASQLPADRIISISHSAGGGFVVTVWYWADDEPLAAATER